MSTIIEQYEELLKEHDPELFVVREQLRDLCSRGFGEVTFTFAIQGGKVTMMRRVLELTNQADRQTGKMRIVC